MALSEKALEAAAVDAVDALHGARDHKRRMTEAGRAVALVAISAYLSALEGEGFVLLEPDEAEAALTACEYALSEHVPAIDPAVHRAHRKLSGGGDDGSV